MRPGGQLLPVRQNMDRAPPRQGTGRQRRAELLLMQAIGFRKGELQRLVLSEHWLLIVLGLAIGVAAALLAVLPTLLSPDTQLPWAIILPMLTLLALGGLLWTWLSTLAALRGDLLPALRN